MKHLYSLTLLLLTATSAQSQKLEIGLNVQYGISGTTQNSTLFYSTANYTFRPGYAAEIQAGYHISPRLKAGLGLQFSQDQNRGTYESHHPDNTPHLVDRYDFRYHYVRIPVYLQYNFIPGHPRIQPFIQAGLNFSLSNGYTYQYTNIQMPAEMYTSGDHSLYYYPGNDWGPQIRIGSTWNINRRFALETAISSYHTLDTYSQKESSHTYQPHIQNYRWVLGCIFRI